MNEEQRKCLEAMKAAIDAALNATDSYETAIETVGNLLDTCPEP